MTGQVESYPILQKRSPEPGTTAGLAGAGLRKEHFPYLEENRPVTVRWFEAVSENYMNSEGRPLEMLLKIRRDFPLALHGTAMSAGSADGISVRYLRSLKELTDRTDPFLVSDHICFSSIAGKSSHDLLPLPYNEETLRTLCGNIDVVQTALKRELVLENISAYFDYGPEISDMTEAHFISELLSRSGCGLLLDINNVYVNLQNRNLQNAKEFISSLPAEKIRQYHIAGHTDEKTHLFDTHSQAPLPEVRDLFAWAMKREPAPFCLEWDDHIPEFKELENELQSAVDAADTKGAG